MKKEKQSQIQQRQFFERLKGKPFWIWNAAEHMQKYVQTNRACCFNHIIGLPQKNGECKPLFDYEKTVIDALEQSKRVWIKKASGLGITELILRYMAWLCVKDNQLRHSQMVIFTGPRLDLAVSLIRRIKGLFEGQQLTFDSKATTVEVSRVRIEAFPSYHTSTARGLPNVSFMLVDEGDFFPSGQQEEVRAVAERYIAKSNAAIAMVSTPNQPGGLFENIEKEGEECLYKRLFLDYTVGLDKIYTKQEIDNVRGSPSFPREYELQYVGVVGNVFHIPDIEQAIREGWDYNPGIPFLDAPKSLGIDPGFGSSSFAFVLTRLKNQRIEVAYADEYERPNFAEMVEETLRLMEKYDNVKHIYIDGANPEFIRALKRELGEREDYENHLTELRRKHVYDVESWVKVTPVPFSKEHKEMLGHTKMLMEKRLVAINEMYFPDLITSLRTAKEEDGSLVKNETAFDDLFDAFRLSLRYYQLKPREQQRHRGYTASQGYRSSRRTYNYEQRAFYESRPNGDFREYRY